MTTDPTSSRERLAQEQQYYFPYHYIPRRAGDRVIYAASVDWAGEYLESLELMGAIVEQTGARRICDLGCGDGRLINELAPRFPDRTFVGIDYSERAISLARLYQSTSNAEFRTGDSTKADADSFDLVMLVEVLEHIPPAEARDFLARAFALVAPGGAMVVTVPHANKPLQKKHYRHFTGTSLRDALAEAVGSAPIDVQYLDRQPSGLNWLLSKVARNRYFTVEPLFQRQLRRRAAGGFVDERRCGRMIARVRRP